MPTPAMHAESTADPTTIKWVVRGTTITGTGVIRGPHCHEQLPAQWQEALRTGVITTVVVADGALLVQARDTSVWPQLAPTLNSSLMSFLSDGNEIHVSSDGRSDHELTQAVQQVLDGPLADYVASHGGKIELVSVDQATVTVRLMGACHGCASAGTTLKAGIAEQLRARYPEIVGVRSLDSTSVTDRGRPLLPSITTRATRHMAANPRTPDN